MKFKTLFLFAILFLLSTKIILAQRFQSNSYIVEWGNFNLTGGTKTSTNYHLSDTVGQMAPGEYNSGAYTLESGFQYIYNTFNKFQFRINDPDMAINFGTLVPEIGTSQSNSITISCPAGHGYQVMVQQNHPLKILAAGVTIPNTSCDSGTPCTSSSSNSWTSNASYGFGYNVLGINSTGTVTGVGTSQYFSDTTKYRPFDTINQIIMSESNPVSRHSARVTYKALISTSQSSGNYMNSITFTAVPNY